MKKIMYAGLFFSLLILNACEKESTILPNNTEKQQQIEVEEMVNQRNSGLCVCDGLVLAKSESGDFSCHGGSGCSKIVPCPCPIVASVGNDVNGLENDLFVESHYDLYKKALVENTLPQFFSTNKWVHIFPNLNQKIILLNKLKTGELTMVEIKTSSGSLMQFCISPEKLGSNINPKDVLFALEIPSGVLSK